MLKGRPTTLSQSNLVSCALWSYQAFAGDLWYSFFSHWTLGFVHNSYRAVMFLRRSSYPSKPPAHSGEPRRVHVIVGRTWTLEPESPA